MSEIKTCFKRVDYDLSNLLHYIDIGDIGLPDIQRPFVWSNTKVRDLFDSMYRGFPVGYLLFWENDQSAGAKSIGTGTKQHAVPHRLIVDGQQRLTALFAVFRGQRVLDEDFQERQIEIAFRPRDGSFEVADAAIRRDPEYIANISELWTSRHSSRKLTNMFLEKLSERQPLSEEEEEQISHNLDRLIDLQKYPFTALEIAPTVDEEQVADIFVRINSEGVKLNQADFILTLLSVFWEEGRKELETFCRASRLAPGPGTGPSPFNHFLQPAPDQLLRVAIALGHKRGRLKAVYQILRGKDPNSGRFTREQREAQFATLRDAQGRVLNLGHWHQYFSCLVGAGYRGSELVSSEIALMYGYAYYLIGRTEYGVPHHRLDKLIGRLFYAMTLSARYTGSFESQLDTDLNRVQAAGDASSFLELLERMISDALTGDFWTINLPNLLDRSSAQSPALFAYHAAQIRLGTPVLFSHKGIADLFDPALRSTRKSLERHHLFPRAWLERQGITELRDINQVANLALIEWPENQAISDTGPAEYLPQIRVRFKPDEWTSMCALHALPEGWEHMDYHDFLAARRKLMANVVRRGYEALV